MRLNSRLPVFSSPQKQGEIVYDLLVSDAAGKAWEVGGQHGEDTKEVTDKREITSYPCLQ